MTSNDVASVVADLNQLMSFLSEFYTNEQLVQLRAKILSGTEWSILSVLYTPDSFHMGLECGGFFCFNGHIKWHLSRAAYAIERSLLDFPSEDIVKPFFTMYDLDSTKNQVCGQGKLYFTLTLFIKECIRQGHFSAYEVGSGPGTGGVHHDHVAKEVKEPFVLNMNDPIATTCRKTIGKVTMNISQSSTELGATFDAPVYSDVFDDHGWDELQSSIKAPFVMKKRVNRDNRLRCGLIIQPFHKEVRELPGYKQLPSLLRGVSSESRCFCSCRDCVILKSMCLSCGIDEATVLMSLMSFGYVPHVRVQGFSDISHRVNCTGSLMHVALRVSQGASIVKDDKELFGDFTPVRVKKRQLRDPNKRREVFGISGFVHRKSMLLSRLQTMWNEFGELLHYGTFLQGDHPWRTYQGNRKEYPASSVLASMPWCKDLLPRIDAIPVGGGFAMLFPMTIALAREIELKMLDSGFVREEKISGVQDTYFLFVRASLAKCTFFHQGVRPFSKVKVGGFNMWGNEQMALTREHIIQALVTGDKSAIDIARFHFPSSSVNRAPIKKQINSLIYAMEKTGVVTKTETCPPIWHYTLPPVEREGVRNPYGNAQTEFSYKQIMNCPRRCVFCNQYHVLKHVFVPCESEIVPDDEFVAYKARYDYVTSVDNNHDAVCSNPHAYVPSPTRNRISIPDPAPPSVYIKVKNRRGSSTDKLNQPPYGKVTKKWRSQVKIVTD